MLQTHARGRAASGAIANVLVKKQEMSPLCITEQQARRAWATATREGTVHSTGSFESMYALDDPNTRGFALGYMKNSRWTAYAISERCCEELGVDFRRRQGEGQDREMVIRNCLRRAFEVLVQASKTNEYYVHDYARVRRARQFEDKTFITKQGFVKGVTSKAFARIAKEAERVYEGPTKMMEDSEEEENAETNGPSKVLVPEPAPAPAPAPAPPPTPEPASEPPAPALETEPAAVEMPSQPKATKATKTPQRLKKDEFASDDEYCTGPVLRKRTAQGRVAQKNTSRSNEAAPIHEQPAQTKQSASTAARSEANQTLRDVIKKKRTEALETKRLANLGKAPAFVFDADNCCRLETIQGCYALLMKKRTRGSSSGSTDLYVEPLEGSLPRKRLKAKFMRSNTDVDNFFDNNPDLDVAVA